MTYNMINKPATAKMSTADMHLCKLIKNGDQFFLKMYLTPSDHTTYIKTSSFESTPPGLSSQEISDAECNRVEMLLFLCL